MIWAAFLAGFLIGSVLVGALAVLTFHNVDRFRARLRNYVDLRDGIEFREMPDRGLNERIYRPKGAPTEISPSVVTRKKVLR
jgi:hypothetical protein